MDALSVSHSFNPIEFEITLERGFNSSMQAKAEITAVLERFQELYDARDVSRLDEFMELVSASGSAELIGIGAAVRGGPEWFESHEAIREIIKSDWEYWGNVKLDVQGARVESCGDVAWLSTTGKLIQTQSFDKALPFYLDSMKKLMEDEESSDDDKLIEATHFGMRRIRERHLGLGHAWPFTFTAVLVLENGKWRFRMIHWSMPVD